MNIKKSKILKLKKKQNALKYWRDKGEWYIMANAFISAVPFAFATSINMGLGFSIFAWVYLWSSIASICVHMLYGKGKMLEKIKSIDQLMYHFVKTNSHEFDVLKEFDKIETMQKEIKAKEREIEKQKRLVENMIELNYLEEREQKLKTRTKTENKQINKVKELQKEQAEEHDLQQ